MNNIKLNNTFNNMKNLDIVINRMYAGDYLSNNLGHEVINMFAADNGNHYLYLNAKGNFDKKRKIGYMLLVKYVGNHKVEVLAMAKNLEMASGADASMPQNLSEEKKEIFDGQREFILNEKITYGGVPLLHIFNGAEQQNIFVTFKVGANSFFKPVKRMFISYKNSDNTCENLDPAKGDIEINLADTNFASTSLKQYITLNSGKDAKNSVADYNKLAELINNGSYWEVSNKGVVPTTEHCKKVDSLFDICKIKDDENVFSNAIYYFMQLYPALWSKFLNEVLKENKKSFKIGSKFTVKREYSIAEEKEEETGIPLSGRIDLLIESEDAVIAVENKILSNINKIDGDDKSKGESQLTRYLSWLSNTGFNNAALFVLAPEYSKNLNIPDGVAGNQYWGGVISYKQLYDFLSMHLRCFCSDANFVAFYNAMERHTKASDAEYLYEEMRDKFYERIKEMKHI